MFHFIKSTQWNVVVFQDHFHSADIFGAVIITFPHTSDSIIPSQYHNWKLRIIFLSFI